MVAQGSLTVLLSGGATISAGSNGSNTLTLSGSQVDINATLTSLSYQGDIGFTGSDTLTITSTDSLAATDIDTVNINVMPSNVAPLNKVPSSLTIAEDTQLTISGIAVNDNDGNLSTVQLVVAKGVLSVTLSGATRISSGANGSNTLTLSGSQADINATLGRLIYKSNLDFSGTDTLTIRSMDSSAARDVDVVLITVTAVNDAPVNTILGSLTAVEDTPFAFGGIKIIDADGNLSTVQLMVNNGTLSVTLFGTTNVSSGMNGSNTLTLSGTQTGINATLASLIYKGDLNYSGVDTLTIISTDSGAASDVDEKLISVLEVNDAPINTVPGVQKAAENGSLALNGISSNEVDGNLLSVQLQVTNGTLVVTLFGTANVSDGINGSNTLTLSGTQTDINRTLSSLYYQANTGFFGLEKLTISSIDSNGLSDIDFIDISVPESILVPPIMPQSILPTVISVTSNLSPIVSNSDLVGNSRLSTSSPQRVPSFVAAYFVDEETSNTKNSLNESKKQLETNDNTDQGIGIDNALMKSAIRFSTANNLSLQIFTETALSSLPLSEIDFTQKYKDFWFEVTQLEDESQKRQNEKELTLRIVAATGLSLTALVAAWLARIGPFFVSFFSVFPAIKSIDPLAILDYSINSDKRESELEEAVLKEKLASYEEIFNNSDPKR